MLRKALKNSLNPENIISTIRYEINDIRQHPLYMRTFGASIFCGSQGEGKTLSAVQYVLKLRQEYPLAILVSNVAIKDYPFNTYIKQEGDDVYQMYSIDSGKLVNTDSIISDHNNGTESFITIEYTGLDDLKFVSNAEYGVIYFIDELHLELNSLESKNIDIEVMVEISQQRKQRKHIVGTSQVFMRLAKPLREQIYDVVLCHKYFNCIQFNKYIDGSTAREVDGKLEAEVKGRYIWFHAPEMYEQYDTYAKMKRYNKEWQGHKKQDNYLIYKGVESN